ncbi:MAG: prepilin-type N-terminal cleavage/methylation domain-containing protein [Planctomycetes bacterium]|nr:prepilin-type N-terminal cleavage/methylation domain-containing protein [Planctomycetota bacterium]
MKRKAFTLVELLVALTVLLVVIIATARIFGTTSKVAAIGEASADLQATATAMEKVIRGDIERIARDGVLGLQCVAVRNDVNRSGPLGAATAPLLDPTRPADEFIRCDQLVFFGRGHEESGVYLGGRSQEQKYALSLYKGGTLKVAPEFTSYEFMVRLGHATQFPSLLVDTNNPTLQPDADFLGTAGTGMPPVPWMWSATPTLSAAYFDGAANLNKYMTSQPEAREWTLARQVVMLADDGNPMPGTTPTAKNATWFHSLQASNMKANSATGIVQYNNQAAGSDPPSPQIEADLTIAQDMLWPNRALTASRVDTAATTIAEFRALAVYGATSSNLSKDFYFDQTGRLPWTKDEGTDPTAATLKLGYARDRIANALFGAPLGPINPANPMGRTFGLWGYPRAEKVAPSMDRTDSMVALPLLAGNCSSIQIDWTWSDGTAHFETPDGTPQVAMLPATPTATPVRNANVIDVPLSGLTTQSWPQQPFMPPSPPNATGAISVTGGATVGNVPRSIPWFGLPDSMFPIQQRRGVTMLAGPSVSDIDTPLSAPSYATAIRALKPSVASDPTKSAPFTPAAGDIETVAIASPPIDCARIERLCPTSPVGVLRPLGSATQVYSYQAIFGPNGDKPFREARYPGGVERVMRTDYTPWPTALRFTITLHDPKLAFSQGRVFQFVVELPKADKP